MKYLNVDNWGRKLIKANQCNTRKEFVRQNFVEICEISVFSMIITKEYSELRVFKKKNFCI